MPVLNVGLIDKLFPVHANRARRCATIQSNLPSRWTIENEVIGDFVEIRAVNGLVEVI